MKTVTRGSLGALAAALLLPLALQAADAPSKAEPKVEAQTAATTTVRKADTACEATTQSRIRPSKAQGCDTGTLPSRTWSKEDLDSTGQINLADALRRLDPRFQ